MCRLRQSARVLSYFLAQSEFTSSYPPPTQYGSAALDLAHYFEPSAHWDTPWYAADKAFPPPPIQGSKENQVKASWRTHNDLKTVSCGILFSDLSICWYSVEFRTSHLADPNDPVVKRGAQYLPRPAPLDHQTLVAAHETYGETVAAYAESFEGTGEYCGSGECWDLANQAIQYLREFDYVPAPVPSIARTHGHLVFAGRALGRGGGDGRWRGGDDRVRRGDIVEWRSARVSTVGAPPGSYMTLGNPEHTAVVVREARPTREPADGEALAPAEIGALEVMEQSVQTGGLPTRVEYDLKTFESGEIWIYRVVGMEVYLGTLFDAKCPEGVRALRV